MRLCDQDDTIGVTTTCDYVSGECLCATYHSCSSSHFIDLHLQPRHAGGTWQLQQRVTEAWLNANWFGYTWLEKVIGQREQCQILTRLMCVTLTA